MKRDMEVLQVAFGEQMKETDKLNRSLTEKMEKINTMLIKFKSDIVLRVEAVGNELQRRAI